MSERRYDDDEVREILVRATEPEPPFPALASASSTVEGHSLEELQAAAAEAGIAPERVAAAAHELTVDRAVLPAARTRLGVPVSTTHVVRLGRMLTPDEWDRFVVRMRDTFETPGAVLIEGSLRTWSHGQLRVLLEPLEVGARLRFESLDENANGLLEGALAMAWGGAFLLVFLGLIATFKEAVPWGLWALAGSLPAVALAALPAGRKRAAEWLPVRHRQFELLGEEARRVASRPGENE